MKITSLLPCICLWLITACAGSTQREGNSIPPAVLGQISRCIASGCTKVHLSRAFSDTQEMKSCLAESLTNGQIHVLRIDKITSMETGNIVPLYTIRSAKSCPEIEISIVIEGLTADTYSSAEIGVVME